MATSGSKKNKRKSNPTPAISSPAPGQGVPMMMPAGTPGMQQPYPVHPVPMGHPVGPPGTFTTYMYPGPPQPQFRPGFQPMPPMQGVPGPGTGIAPRPAQAQSQKQLDFNQAMSDFQKMFPKMDRDVIETVLRSNEGKVDETIDQLLKLNADIPDAPPMTQPYLPPSQFPPGNLDEPPPYSPPEPNSPYSRFHPASNSPNTSTTTTTTATSALNDLPYYPIERPPMSTPSSGSRRNSSNQPGVGNLPSEFLRLSMSESRPENGSEGRRISRNIQDRLEANKSRRKSVDNYDVESVQIVEDERIALLLQNEEFVNQLQRNPEFMSALERDYQDSLQDRNQRPATSPTAKSAQSKRRSVDMSNRPLPATPGPEPPPRPLSIHASPGGASERPVDMSDIEFRDKLTHMGKTSKTKLSFLAGKFNKKKNKGQKYARDPSDGIYEEMPEDDGGYLVPTQLGRPPRPSSRHEYMTHLDFEHSSC